MSIDLKELIKMLPTIANYIVPGAIYLWAYRYCIFADTNITKNIFTFETVIFSYILNVCIEYIFSVIGHIPNEFGIILISLVCGLLFGKIRTWQWFDENICGNIFHQVLSNNMWHGISDREKGMYIKIFLRDENISYNGIFMKYFQSDGETWLMISSYTLKDNQNEEIYSHNKANNYCVAIATKDINRVELFYDKDSKKVYPSK